MAESALSLVERLRAAFDRAEEIARAATGGKWTARTEYPHLVFQGDPNDFQTVSTNLAGSAAADAIFIAEHCPAHVLRTVAAHRKILEAVERWLDPHPGQECTNVDDEYSHCELHVAVKDKLPPYALTILAAVYFPEAPDA